MIPLALAAGAFADEPDMELVIEAHRPAEMEREALIQSIRDLGYAAGVDLGERVIFVPLKPWEPLVVLHESGWVRVSGHRVTPMWARPTPSGGQVHGVFGGKRMVAQQEERVYLALQPAVQAWNEATQAEALARRLLEVQTELRLIWSSGSPAAERRAAIAALWLATTDTDAGAAVRAAVLEFSVAVVQRSDAPFTEEEVAALNARAPGPDRFTLD